jgi:hypothetical protein
MALDRARSLGEAEQVRRSFKYQFLSFNLKNKSLVLIFVQLQPGKIIMSL